MEKEQFLNNVHIYLKLIADFLNKKESNLEIDKNTLSFFIKLSKHHSTTALLYKAIVGTKAKIEQETLDKLEQHYLLNLRKVALFSEERKALFEYLNNNQIHYLPLKGIVINDYYPDPYIREFADNDILFEDKGSSLIKQFFVKRDYDVKAYKKSNHDVYMKKPFYNFEMHRDLFYANEDNAKNVKYFKDYLSKAPIRENYEHYLNNEDFYIYFIAHTYKHFHVSGCGMRTLVDIYLYLKNNELDFNYVNKELEKLELLEFSNKIIDLSNKIFKEESLTEEQEEMLLFIASSGTYGTLAHSVDKGVKEKGKFKYFMIRVFPPYSFYKMAYPWAYYFPLLIPIAWLCRFFRILFHNPKKATKELKMISEHKNED